ncbi:hypothetical protein Tco_0024630 [Tanacetum coccineum]
MMVRWFKEGVLISNGAIAVDKGGLYTVISQRRFRCKGWVPYQICEKTMCNKIATDVSEAIPCVVGVKAREKDDRSDTLRRQILDKLSAFISDNYYIYLTGSGYQQKDRKPSQNDKTEHGMEKTVQNQGQSPKMPKSESKLKNTIRCNLNPSDGPGKPNSIIMKTVKTKWALNQLQQPICVHLTKTVNDI